MASSLKLLLLVTHAHGGTAILSCFLLLYYWLLLLRLFYTVCFIYLSPRSASSNVDIQSLLDQLTSLFLRHGDFNVQKVMFLIVKVK